MQPGLMWAELRLAGRTAAAVQQLDGSLDCSASTSTWLQPGSLPGCRPGDSILALAQPRGLPRHPPVDLTTLPHLGPPRCSYTDLTVYPHAQCRNFDDTFCAGAADGHVTCGVSALLPTGWL